MWIQGCLTFRVILDFGKNTLHWNKQALFKASADKRTLSADHLIEFIDHLTGIRYFKEHLLVLDHKHILRDLQKTIQMCFIENSFAN